MAAIVAPRPASRRVAVATNPYAPVPATQSPQMMQRRGITAPSQPTATAAPPVTTAPSMGATAYAAQQANGSDNPLTGFIKGFVDAGAYREEQAAEQGKKDQVADALTGHVDLARFVKTGVMEPSDAIRIAGDRDALVKKEQVEADKVAAEIARKAKVSEYLRQSGDTAVADQFDAGIISEDDLFEAINPKEDGTDDLKEYQVAVDQGFEGTFVDYQKAMKGGETESKPPQIETRYNEDTGLEEKMQWDPEKKDWVPFGGVKATTASTRPMSPTTQKELFEADEAVQAAESVAVALERALELNKKAWDGPLADIGTQAGSLVGDENSVATQDLKNLVISQALDQLKATFGGMPTEGERKILLEIQGSVTQSRANRKLIFERAQKAVEKRLEFNRKKAEGLRSGEYFQPEYGSSSEGQGEGPPAPEGVDPGLWSEMTPEEQALWN